MAAFLSAALSATLVSAPPVSGWQLFLPEQSVTDIFSAGLADVIAFPDASNYHSSISSPKLAAISGQVGGSGHLPLAAGYLSAARPSSVPTCRSRPGSHITIIPPCRFTAPFAGAAVPIGKTAQCHAWWAIASLLGRGRAAAVNSTGQTIAVSAYPSRPASFR